VLIVDHSLRNGRLLQEQVADWGVRSEIRADRRGALDALRQAAAAGDPFRAVIVECGRPGGDGEALGRAIQADPGSARPRWCGWAPRTGPTAEPAAAAPTRRSPHTCASPSALPGCSSRSRPRWPRPAHAGGERPPAPGVRRRKAGAGARRARPARRPRVLVAEDDPVHRRLAQLLLERVGCLVDLAPDGAGAIEMLATESYDLVLMDCQMPRMDGYEPRPRCGGARPAGGTPPSSR
jgi:CheY-like chemotaxis protein